MFTKFPAVFADIVDLLVILTFSSSGHRNFRRLPVQRVQVLQPDSLGNLNVKVEMKTSPSRKIVFVLVVALIVFRSRDYWCCLRRPGLFGAEPAAERRRRDLKAEPQIEFIKSKVELDDLHSL